jgi:hypothetical protein
MRTGTIISGIGHLGLILWLLFGGLLFPAHDQPALQASSVSLVTSEQLAALNAQASAPPAKPQTQVAALAPAPKVADQAPAPKPEPVVKPAKPSKPAPQPVPKPTVPTPPPPPPPPPPRQAPRVSDTPTPKPAPDAKVADQVQQDVSPDATNPVQVKKPPKEATAPKEAAAQIVPEAKPTDSTAPSPELAPKTSPRPQTRPAPTPDTSAADAQAAADAKAAADQAKADAKAKADQAKADAKAKAEAKATKAKKGTTSSDVAAALSGMLAADAGNGATSGAVSKGKKTDGPPLTGAEKDGFLTALKSKWVVDPGSESASVIVTVAFSLNQDGTVIATSIKMLSASGSTNDSAIRAAFESARRAILRGSAAGFGLPADKYDTWRDTEITFNPKEMSLR